MVYNLHACSYALIMTTLIMFRGIHRWLCRFPMFEDNGLSERELEILKLVATGASNKEIAAQGNFVEYPAENAAVESLPGPEPRQWRRQVIIGALIVIIGIVVFLSIR